MQIIRTISEMQATGAGVRCAGRRIGFVPTMGFLHAGHLSLVQEARRHADWVVVSIFVNPIQFSPNEDLAAYPRDFARDEQLCAQAGVDVVFYPEPSSMYHADHSVYVEENMLSSGLCGAQRPGHFRGVLTVVAKLFNIVGPDVAVFGQKDAQQARLIRQMVRDLDFPVGIVVAPIVREPDGLAMSSRNVYLTADERSRALWIYKALCHAEALYRAGERSAAKMEAEIRAWLAKGSPRQIEYVQVVDYNTLKPVDEMAETVLIAVCIRMGKARLIDNLILGGTP
jgi:pantoate--beta-alanine ligase